MNICIRILHICLLVMFANCAIDEIHMTCDLDLRENVIGDMCLDIYMKRNDVKGQLMAGYLLEAESLFNMTMAQEIWDKTKELECAAGKLSMLHPLELYVAYKIHQCYKHNTRELFHGCLIKKRRLVAEELRRRPKYYIRWQILPQARFLVNFDDEEINGDEGDLL